ncbi:MAG: RNA-binding S4 domain-containing protein [Firmicutes bacterium]|nr:RNA-binding S4 domain-containing protein [Bacillota bacterium]
MAEREARAVPVARPPIALSAFLKLAGAARTGGEAKAMCAAGRVRVNGRPEPRRGRSLVPGDHVEVDGVRLRVEHADEGGRP